MKPLGIKRLKWTRVRRYLILASLLALDDSCRLERALDGLAKAKASPPDSSGLRRVARIRRVFLSVKVILALFVGLGAAWAAGWGGWAIGLGFVATVALVFTFVVPRRHSPLWWRAPQSSLNRVLSTPLGQALLTTLGVGVILVCIQEGVISPKFNGPDDISSIGLADYKDFSGTSYPTALVAMDANGKEVFRSPMNTPIMQALDIPPDYVAVVPVHTATSYGGLQYVGLRLIERDKHAQVVGGRDWFPSSLNGPFPDGTQRFVIPTPEGAFLPSDGPQWQREEMSGGPLALARTDSDEEGFGGRLLISTWKQDLAPCMVCFHLLPRPGEGPPKGYGDDEEESKHPLDPIAELWVYGHVFRILVHVGESDANDYIVLFGCSNHAMWDCRARNTHDYSLSIVTYRIADIMTELRASKAKRNVLIGPGLEVEAGEVSEDVRVLDSVRPSAWYCIPPHREMRTVKDESDIERTLNEEFGHWWFVWERLGTSGDRIEGRFTFLGDYKGVLAEQMSKLTYSFSLPLESHALATNPKLAARLFATPDQSATLESLDSPLRKAPVIYSLPTSLPMAGESGPVSIARVDKTSDLLGIGMLKPASKPYVLYRYDLKSK